MSGSISGTPTNEEDWTLDALGNWAGYVTKTAGSTDLDQARTVNSANEVTNVTETTGPSWANPAFDNAGNMTSVPKPSNLTGTYTATYDAWNRLVKLEDGMTIVAEYAYDGENRQIVKSVYSGGSLSHKEHTYYNQQWQAMEVRKETSGIEDTDPLEQYVWHPFYIDAALLRDYDASTSGTQVRHYYIFDGNFNVTALTDNSGMVVERYHYTPFGQIRVLDSNFSMDADNTSDVFNSISFTGRNFDSTSGLLHFRRRVIHTIIGNFLQRDPAGYIDGANLSAMYFNVNTVDPTGMGTCEIGNQNMRNFNFKIPFYVNANGKCGQYNLDFKVKSLIKGKPFGTCSGFEKWPWEVGVAVGGFGMHWMYCQDSSECHDGVSQECCNRKPEFKSEITTMPILVPAITNSLPFVPTRCYRVVKLVGEVRVNSVYGTCVECCDKPPPEKDADGDNPTDPFPL